MPYKDGLRFATDVAMAIFLTSLPANCQHNAGGGTAPGGGTTGAPTNTPSITNNSNNTNYNATSSGDLGERGVYLSGTVQMEDGTPLSQQVLIERVCGGYRKAEGYTDLKGRFSFQLGQEQAVTSDASFEATPGPPGSSQTYQTIPQNKSIGSPTNQPQVTNTDKTAPGRSLIGCELIAVVAGFRSDSVNLSGRRALDSPDVGTLFLHRLANVEGSTVSATTLLAPKDARKAYDKALEALSKGKVADAWHQLEKAVEVYPQFAAAWYQLGVLRERNKELAVARQSYEQAIVADPKFVSPYLPLAVLEGRDKDWQAMASTTSRLIRLDAADFPEAYYYNAAANYNLKKIDEAESSALQAIKLDTAHRFPGANHILGLILYRKKDYAGAVEQMRSYLELAPKADDAAEVKHQLADMERRLAMANPAPTP